MVCVLAVRSKVRGFKHSRGVGFLRAIKIRNTPPFADEVKPEAKRREISWNVK
jgi:hypothetical protein